MSITLDNSAAPAKQSSPSSPYTFAYSMGTGPDPLLVVVLSALGTATTYTVTYDGVSMTKAATGGPAAGGAQINIFYLTAPATGSNSVSVAWTGGSVTTLQVGIASFFGVNQSSPFDSDANTNSRVGQTANTVTQSLTTSLASDLIVSGSILLATGGSGYTQPSSYTSIYDDATSGFYASAEYDLNVGAAGSHSETWTVTGSPTAGKYGVAAVSFFLAPAVTRRRPAQTVLF